MLQPTSKHIFISYSRRDDAVMRKIAFFLRDQNLKVWVDHEKLIPGTTAWEESIENAIKNSLGVIVILSPEAKNSEWVRREITYADQFQRRVFPVLARGDEDDSLPIRLITRQYVDFRTDENAGLNALYSAITFYIKEKQTLEMQRPSAKQEIVADPVSTHGAAAPNQKKKTPKWILPAGIFSTICILLLCVLGIGNRIYSSLIEQPAQSNLTDPTSTASIFTPEVIDAPANTSIPPTEIVSAPATPLEYLEGMQVLNNDTFDDPLASGWKIPAGAINGGVLEIVGNENWDGASRDKVFGEGEGIIVDFSYSTGSLFEIIVDYGEYDTDPYRRFGIYIENDHVDANISAGKEYLGGTLSGNLALEPDTTYSLLMAILPNGELLEVIWNPSDPSETLYYREKFDPTWAGLTWTFYLQANQGTILFDDFREISFSGAK
jgi:hypothetical protein